MYGIFEINPKAFIEVSAEYESMIKQLEHLTDKIDCLKNNLTDSTITQLKPVLNNIGADIKTYASSITSLQTIMEESIKAYELAETSILETADNTTTEYITATDTDASKPTQNTEFIPESINTSNLIPTILLLYLQSLLSEGTACTLDNSSFTSRSTVTSSENGDAISTTETKHTEILANETGLNISDLGRSSASSTYSDFFNESTDSFTSSDENISDSVSSSGGSSADSSGGTSSNESAAPAKQTGTGVTASMGNSKGSGSSKKISSTPYTTANARTASGKTRKNAVTTISATSLEDIPKKSMASTAAVASIAVVLSAGLSLGLKQFADKDSDASSDVGKSVAGWA